MNRSLRVIVQLNESLEGTVSHLYKVLTDANEFRALRIYVRGDGSYLAIVKGYDGDGAEVICFGQGTDAVTALLAVDGAIAAGNWRVDKPWGARNG